MDGNFVCGTTKTSCYNGLVSAGLVTPGADAGTSVLGTPHHSPLCGPLGGDMPYDGTACVTDEQVVAILAWLGAGAPNN